VKDIETHADRGRRFCLGLLRLTARGIGQWDPSLQPLPPIGNDMFQVRPRCDDLTPALAATIRTALSRQLRHFAGLDAQQNGLAMQKVCIKDILPRSPLHPLAPLGRFNREVHMTRGRPPGDEPTCVLAVRVPVALREELDRSLDALETRLGLKASRTAIIRHALRVLLAAQQEEARPMPPHGFRTP
jgi:hypothetical protein